MRAEKTRHLINSMLDKIFHKDNHLSNLSILHAHLAASDKEMIELERLARIGMSAEEFGNEMKNDNRVEGNASFDVYVDTSIGQILDMLQDALESVLPYEDTMYTNDKIRISVEYLPENK